MKIQGVGPLAVLMYDPQIIPSDFCRINSKESKDGQFYVEDLQIEYSPERDKDGIPRMKDLIMDYSFGGIELNWSDICIKHEVVYYTFDSATDHSKYNRAYGFVHRGESFPLVYGSDIPYTFRATNWTTCNCGTIGEKEWQMTGGDTSNGSAELYEEKGSFKLIHRPK